MVVAYDYIMSYASNHFNKPIEKEAGYNASFLFVLEYANANCKCVLQTNCKQLKANCKCKRTSKLQTSSKCKMQMRTCKSNAIQKCKMQTHECK